MWHTVASSSTAKAQWQSHKDTNWCFILSLSSVVSASLISIEQHQNTMEVLTQIFHHCVAKDMLDIDCMTVIFTLLWEWLCVARKCFYFSLSNCSLSPAYVIHFSEVEMCYQRRKLNLGKKKNTLRNLALLSEAAICYKFDFLPSYFIFFLSSIPSGTSWALQYKVPLLAPNVWNRKIQIIGAVLNYW